MYSKPCAQPTREATALTAQGTGCMLMINSRMWHLVPLNLWLYDWTLPYNAAPAATPRIWNEAMAVAASCNQSQ